jgi:hypothetical protein
MERAEDRFSLKWLFPADLAVRLARVLVETEEGPAATVAMRQIFGTVENSGVFPLGLKIFMPRTRSRVQRSHATFERIRSRGGTLRTVRNPVAKRGCFDTCGKHARAIKNSTT